MRFRGISSDMSTRPELGPWLANVYIREDRRNLRLGSRLVKATMAHAREQGIARLYLFTRDQQRFYQRLGWQTFDYSFYQETGVTIMTFVI